MKLPSEEFLPPVEKFNLAVGPLFSELRNRFPLDEHRDSALQRSLGIFLAHCFQTAKEGLEKLKPEPLSREQWLAAPQAVKQEAIHWQRNLAYLRQRNFKLMVTLGYRVSPEGKGRRNPEDDEAF